MRKPAEGSNLGFISPERGNSLGKGLLSVQSVRVRARPREQPLGVCTAVQVRDLLPVAGGLEGPGKRRRVREGSLKEEGGFSLLAGMIKTF